MRTKSETYHHEYAPGLTLDVVLSDAGVYEDGGNDSPSGWDWGHAPNLESAVLTVHGLKFDYLEGKPPAANGWEWLKVTHPTKFAEVEQAMEKYPHKTVFLANEREAA